MVAEQDIWQALSTITDPGQGRDIVSLGMVSGLQNQNGHVLFALEVDPARGPALEPLRAQAEQAVAALPGVDKVTAVMTATRTAPVVEGTGKKRAHIENLAPTVRHIVAVASGKGGVGKSTVAANLAVSFARLGYKTGLLDADIYGPSAPHMFGVVGQKPDVEDGKLTPLEAHGVKLISMGALVDAEAPMIWRGPMIQSAVRQFLADVRWGDLDVLVVDMPPGTGDAQLTLVQKARLSGAVIVSTPQDIALIDARKGLNMFRKTDVKVLGIIENMSVYICPRCEHEEHIFGEQGARREAEKLGCPFLGEVPLNIDIRLSGDAGTPVTITKPDSKAATIFADIASNIARNIGL